MLTTRTVLFPLAHGNGFADYLLYVDGQAVGVIEAKEEGTPLTGVEHQAKRYAHGISEAVPAPVRRVAFRYLSTGVETRFANYLDPEPKSPSLFHFHRPEPVAIWIRARGPQGVPAVHDAGRPEVHRAVQRLTSNRIDSVARVVITTIQRLYSRAGRK